MNKLEGLYELKSLQIPSVDWKLYTSDTVLDDRFLWTIRTAVFKGSDFCLPHSFGKDSKTSKEFADRTLRELGEKGIVIYYPYLIAEKSGILQFSKDRLIIEGVYGDLGELLSGKKADVTYIWTSGSCQSVGDKDFFNANDQELLLSNGDYLRRKYSLQLLLGEEIQLEFSFSYDSSVDGKRVGDRKLVFFEVRTL